MSKITIPSLLFLSAFARTDEEDPLKVFRFQVEIDGFARFGFSKCSKLAAKTDVVKYREGGDNSTPKKSPGLTNFDPITLERGQILAAGFGHLDTINWYKQVFDASVKNIGSSKVFRKEIDIVQFDKEGTERLRWRVVEVWPSDQTPMGDFDAMTSENSIESLVLEHEGYRLIGQ